MKLYAQQGYGTGDRIARGLECGWIDGAILSPKDSSLARIQGLLRTMEESYPSADRLFDPQFYASVIPVEDAKWGKLSGEDFPYLQARRRSQLESEAAIREDLLATLQFQKELPLTAAIGPNITIRQSLNSIEAVVAKNFIRETRSVWNELGGEVPVYATLAIDAIALQDRHELQNFLTDITLLEDPPDGFYLLINHPTAEIPSELIDHRTLAGWMMLNHSLSINGFEVINGYSDILSPLLAAAGATAGATGWWSNLKVFSLDRFQISTGGGRRPVARYLSKNLLNSIRFDELDRLRNSFPELLNGLDSDDFYLADNGSQPDSQVEEVLQSWETIGSYWQDGAPSLADCQSNIVSAENFYRRLKASPGVSLPARSNDNHLESIEDGINLFAELAELEL